MQLVYPVEQLRLTGEQEEQRSTLQDEIKTLEASLQAEQDPFKTEDLQREVGQKKDELSSLLASFEVGHVPGTHSINCQRCLSSYFSCMWSIESHVIYLQAFMLELWLRGTEFAMLP